MANPLNNDFEIWTDEHHPENWTHQQYDNGICNKSTDKYEGAFACELYIETPHPYSGQYSSVKSSNFIAGDSVTVYLKIDASSESLDTNHFYVGVYVYRASNGAYLAGNTFYDADLSSSYVQKSIDISTYKGIEIYIKIVLSTPMACLPDFTLIETKEGNIKIMDVKEGDEVIGGKVLKIVKFDCPSNHKYYKFITEDGIVIASKNHPFKSKIIKIELCDIKSEFVCDILTESGYYKINGVTVKSTLGEI